MLCNIPGWFSARPGRREREVNYVHTHTHTHIYNKERYEQNKEEILKYRRERHRFSLVS